MKKTVLITLLVLGLATSASWLLPEAYSGAAVGAIFLLATARLCLRRSGASEAERLRESDYGLELFGILVWKGWAFHGRQLASALGVLALIIPPYLLLAWVFYAAKTGSGAEALWVQLAKGSWLGAADYLSSQLFAVALPEEVFFRGYVQTELKRHRSFAWQFGPFRLPSELFWTSALFALGHFTTVPHPARLAVFFPSLLFAWLREETGSVESSIWLHFGCNLLSAVVFVLFH